MDHLPVSIANIVPFLSGRLRTQILTYIGWETRSRQLLSTCRCIGVTDAERSEVTEQLGIDGLERYLEWKKGGAPHRQALLASEVSIDPRHIRHLIGCGR